MKSFIAIIFGVLCLTPALAAPNPFGVNISGAEFPVWNKQAFPAATDFAYLASKGISRVRLPIAWESLQPTLGGPLDATYLGSIKTAISLAHANGIGVIVDIHNSGAYCSQALWSTAPNWTTCGYAGNAANPATGVNFIGDSVLTQAQFVNLWSQLALALEGTPGLIGYDLMNEPTNLVGSWPTLAQAAINAIRAVDAMTPIYVEGTGWSGAPAWISNNAGLASLTGGNLVFSAHYYFDAAEGVDGSGSYANPYSSYNIDANSGTTGVHAFLTWLAVNHLQGDIGEFAVANSPQWLALQANFIALIRQNGLTGTMWNYNVNPQFKPGVNTLVINPLNGVDDPRLLQIAGPRN